MDANNPSPVSDGKPWYADGERGWADYALFLGTGGASSLFGGDVDSVVSWGAKDTDGDGKPNATDGDSVPDVVDGLGLKPVVYAAAAAVGLGILGRIARWW